MDQLSASDSTIHTGKPTSAWIAFEHILLFISMYVLAISISYILSALVDTWYPTIQELTSPNTFTPNIIDALMLVRVCLASAIVSLPIFCFFFLSTAKAIIQTPTIAQNHARKILIYSTLILTFIIMLINIIATVYAFVSGNVTIALLLHLGIILSINGVIFGFYFVQIKNERKRMYA